MYNLMSERLPHISEVTRCKDNRCAKPIIYRKRLGKAHPFDVVVENNQVIEVRGSHFDTCKYASNFRPKRRQKPQPDPELDDISEVKKGSDFDFEKWFRQRFSLHTPHGEKHRPGTFTLREEDLLRDLVYDYRRACGGKEKKAIATCKRAIIEAKCLILDERGYALKGEPRIRFDEMWRIISDE